MSNKRNRTPSEYIGYGLYLYFLGLSLRNVAKAMFRVTYRSREAMLQSGNGFKNFVLERYHQQGERKLRNT